MVGAVPATPTVPPLNETVGFEVKPKPGTTVGVVLITEGELPERATVTTALIPPPPLMTTFGGTVYVVVPAVIVKLPTVRPRLAAAFAELPPPPDTATVTGAGRAVP